MQNKVDFMQKYGGVYEHSPWIAEAAFAACAQGIDAIHAAMKAAVDAAPRDKKLALICAHPDLANKAKMTAESVSEQKGAGLDQCTAEEFAEFQHLNAAYKEKFGFPFIVAVKGMTRHDILNAFRTRLHNDVETEFETAIAQIHRIARFRLEVLDQAASRPLPGRLL